MITDALLNYQVHFQLFHFHWKYLQYLNLKTEVQKALCQIVLKKNVTKWFKMQRGEFLEHRIKKLVEECFNV